MYLIITFADTRRLNEYSWNCEHQWSASHVWSDSVWKADHAFDNHDICDVKRNFVTHCQCYFNVNCYYDYLAWKKGKGNDAKLLDAMEGNQRQYAKIRNDQFSLYAWLKSITKAIKPRKYFRLQIKIIFGNLISMDYLILSYLLRLSVDIAKTFSVKFAIF